MRGVILMSAHHPKGGFENQNSLYGDFLAENVSWGTVCF